MAAACSVSPAAWRQVCEDLLDRVSARFSRIEPRLVARDFVTALLAPVEAKNCWQLAEQAGHARPSRMQRLLRDAVWDAEKVRDDLRSYVVQQLHHPDAVLVADETGFLKKGVGSVGVQRQYCGTAGRIENSQVAVFLAYASLNGRALIDRRIYMPRSWTGDPRRCAAAGVPDEVEFATKPRLAQDMIEAALDAGVKVKFVTGDECYGRDPGLRQCLQDRGIGYVLAVARNHYTQITTGSKNAPTSPNPGYRSRRGNAIHAGRGPKGNGSTTGPGSPSTTRAQASTVC